MDLTNEAELQLEADASDDDPAAQAAREQDDSIIGQPPYSGDADEPVYAPKAVEDTKRGLTPEESDAEVKAIMDRYAADQENVDAERTLVLEFGLLEGMAKRMCRMADDQVREDIAVVVKAQIRRAIHDGVIENPIGEDNHRSENAIAIREKTVHHAKSRMESNLLPLLARLDKAEAKGAADLIRGLRGETSSELQRIKTMKANTRSVSLGENLFNGLTDGLSSLAGRRIEGDARRHRNRQLSDALEQLHRHTDTLRKKTGDGSWEATDGITTTTEVGKLQRKVKNLTRGVENQIDGPALSKNLKDINANLAEAFDKSATEDHKESLKELINKMREIVDALINAVGRMFGRGSDAPRPV